VQVTLDDLWSLDLVKLNGWKQVKDNTAGKEDFEENIKSASEDESDDEDGDDLDNLPRCAYPYSCMRALHLWLTIAIRPLK
jgi:hypothetical protein